MRIFRHVRRCATIKITPRRIARNISELNCPNPIFALWISVKASEVYYEGYKQRALGFRLPERIEKKEPTRKLVLF